jgi:Ca-activated chloride channel family protein
MPPEVALKLLKECGVKVYTIGIGSPKGGLIDHPIYGVVTIQTPLNVSLLKHIAQQTGGQYFEAKNAADMAQIYQTIDTLEKTERDIPWWLQGYELKQPILWTILGFILFELMLRWIWILL